jgi:hypothetical protein
MNQARWEQIQDCVHQAVRLAKSQRAVFLQQACGSDRAVLAELSGMLAAEEADVLFICDRNLDAIASQVLGDPGDSITAQEFGPYRLKQMLGERRSQTIEHSA